MLLQLKTQSSSPSPIRVFYSYSHKDEELKELLDEHLSILQREGFISVWHDRKVEPGQEWASQIHRHLESADLVLLLISASFIKSEYCYGTEMKRALERHAAGEARVIPVLLRPVIWQIAPFARLQALPRNGKAVVSWKVRDEAFADIAESIRLSIATFPVKAPVPPQSSVETYWVLRIGGSREIESIRAEEIVSQLRLWSGDSNLRLEAVTMSEGTREEPPRFETSLILTGSDSGIRLIQALLENGTLSIRLGYAVEALYPAYGSTVLSTAAPSEDIDERSDLVLLPSRETTPPLLKAMLINPVQPLNFQLLIDGGTSKLSRADFVLEEEKLSDYLRAALTVEEDDLWVNLSAYESNRMIPPVLGGTQMGRDLLDQDCVLKRFTASLMHPDREPGRSYWEAVFSALRKTRDSIDFPVTSMQKVWLKPGKAVVFEKDAGVEPDPVFKDWPLQRDQVVGFIVENELTVLCERDRLAFNKHSTADGADIQSSISDLCLAAFKDHILPVIAREVNQCELFEPIRQIYSALTLAAWYKRVFGDIPAVKELLSKGPERVHMTISSEQRLSRGDGNDQQEVRKISAACRKLIAVHNEGVEPESLREIHDLAARLREEGEVIDARKVQEETLRVSSLLYGEGSYDTQVSMSQLGRTLRALGEMAAARKLHEAVVELRRRYLGDYHPYTLNSMKILADTLGAQGALLESERLHNRIQHLRTVAAGGDFSGSLFEITENSYFYSQYMRLFREGVFQCSRKHADETTGKVLTWSYVSGAIRFGDSERWLTREK